LSNGYADPAPIPRILLQQMIKVSDDWGAMTNQTDPSTFHLGWSGATEVQSCVMFSGTVESRNQR